MMDVVLTTVFLRIKRRVGGNLDVKNSHLKITVPIANASYLDPETFIDDSNLFFGLMSEVSPTESSEVDLIYIQLGSRLISVDVLDLKAVIAAFDARKYK